MSWVMEQLIHDLPDQFINSFGNWWTHELMKWLNNNLVHNWLQQLINETGIKVIPDSWGGFAHSDAIHIIKQGQLHRILDWDSNELTQLVSKVEQ